MYYLVVTLKIVLAASIRKFIKISFRILGLLGGHLACFSLVYPKNTNKATLLIVYQYLFPTTKPIKLKHDLQNHKIINNLCN